MARKKPGIAVIKKLVRERDGMCCTECGLTDQQHREKYGKKLEVHRLVPGSRYETDGCITLCRECHAVKPKSRHGTRPVLLLNFSADILSRVIAMSDRLGINPSSFVRMVVIQSLPRYERDEAERRTQQDKS